MNAVQAPLPALERSLVNFARDLTLNPRRNDPARARLLRSAGLDDKGILRATEIVAYFNFVNRLAHGLCVELESPG